MAPPLSPHRPAIRQMLLDGKRVMEIARVLDIDPGWVSKIAGEMGLRPPRRTRNPMARFLRYVLTEPGTETNGTPCVRWIGKLNTSGYGSWSVGPLHGSTPLAHRWIYEAIVGAIPAGMELDHLCSHRWCVNPWHLEPVTHQENVDRSIARGSKPRKTHCIHGHEYTPENTYVNPRGSRICRECTRIRQRRSAA